MKCIRVIAFIGLLLCWIGCGGEKQHTDKKSEASSPITSKPVENISATPDQRARRLASEEICKSKGVPNYKNPNSLWVDSEEDVELRTQDEVVDRAIALLFIGLKSEGLEQVHLDKVKKGFDVSAKLSPVEKEYVNAGTPTEQQAANANWRYESLHVLLWSLSFIDELVYPAQLCNVADDVKIIYELGPAKFRDQSKLRTKTEILDQADLILRFDWACVNARVKGEEAPGGLNSSVVYERHYSLNWLIKYLNQNWDDVTTNT